jgi:ATP-dependent Lhr-like helicase
MERGDFVKTALLPSYVGFTTPDKLNLYRSAKERPDDEKSRIVYDIVRDNQPVSRKEVIARSPMNEDDTVEALNYLFHQTEIYQDSSSKYLAVSGQRMDRYEALKEIAKMHIKDFGMFTADTLAQFINVRMSIVRKILAELEDEGMLVKGFLFRDDPTVVWMLKSDIDGPVHSLRNETFLLNTQDNLHVYLRDMIKREAGATENVVFKGTRIIGSFKGKMTISGAKVEDFKGSPEAKRYIKDLSISLGVKIEDTQRIQEDKDWDVSEFYIKTNPGAI